MEELIAGFSWPAAGAGRAWQAIQEEPSPLNEGALPIRLLDRVRDRVAERRFALGKVKQSEKMSAPPNETYAKLAIPEKSGMMNKKELKS